MLEFVPRGRCNLRGDFGMDMVHPEPMPTLAVARTGRWVLITQIEPRWSWASEIPFLTEMRRGWAKRADDGAAHATRRRVG